MYWSVKYVLYQAISLNHFDNKKQQNRIQNLIERSPKTNQRRKPNWSRNWLKNALKTEGLM
ncbi:hypothetical protein COK39_25630 [Priestia megaterium]|nr:hypothetical protein COK39_25630 [Priestia megaterium]